MKSFWMTPKGKVRLCLIFIWIFLIVLYGNETRKVYSSEPVTMSQATFYGNPFTQIILICVLYLLCTKKTDNKYNGYVDLNNTTAEFESLYKKLYSEKRVKLEKPRKELKEIGIIVNLVMTVVIITFFFNIINSTNKVDLKVNLLNNLAIVFITIAFMGFAIFQREKIKKRYVDIYKKEVVTEFIKLINENLEYNNLQQFLDMKSEYKKVGFENKRFNTFIVDDKILGKISDDLAIKMADIDVKNITENQAETIFSGLFAIIEQNKKELPTKIKIMRSKNKFIQKENIVNLDNEDFEKYFDIYSEDKILAMRILTIDVTQSIVDFYARHNVNFDIVFMHNKIYIRFEVGEMFEPPIMRNSMDKRKLLTYYVMVKFVFEVAEKLNKALEDIEI